MNEERLRKAMVEERFNEYVELLEKEVRHQALLMREEISAMAASAERILKLAKEGVAEVKKLSDEVAYKPNLGEFLAAEVERYNEAERRLKKASLDKRSFQYLLDKAKGITEG